MVARTQQLYRVCVFCSSVCFALQTVPCAQPCSNSSMSKRWSMCSRACVCVYMFVHVCRRIYACVHVHAWVQENVCVYILYVCVRRCVCMFVHVCRRMCVQRCECIYKNTDSLPAAMLQIPLPFLATINCIEILLLCHMGCPILCRELQL